ncbi:MAG: S8 family serine peptidase [Fibrobacter sp.]|nr:S8 family serine peptidase [Fibrobacter sp.]
MIPVHSVFFTLLLSTFVFVSGAQNRFSGYFDVGCRPVIPNKDELNKRSGQLSPNKGRKKVLLLVDASFRQSSLSRAGCRFISQRFNIVTAECHEDLIPYLTALDGVLYVSEGAQGFTQMDSVRNQIHADEVIGTRPSDLPEHFSGKNVLVGVMDTEFDTRHPAFLDSSGVTRFIALWNQSDTSAPHSNRYGYGVVKRHDELIKDTLFGSGGHFHGTHVASLIAGSDRTYNYHGVAPDAIIAGVKYQNSTEAELVNGLDWFFSLADSLKLPCVVNLSIGMASGPRDGTSLFDRFVDSISGPGKIIVGAVGNDYDRKTHVLFNLAANQTEGTFVTPVFSSGDSAYYSYADIWGESGKTFSVSFLIIDTISLNYRQSSTRFTTSSSIRYLPDAILWKDSQSGLTDTFTFQIGIERSSPLNRKPHAYVSGRTKNPRLFMGFQVTAGKNTQKIHTWNPAKVPMKSFAMEGFFDGDSLYSVNEIGGTANRIITVGSYAGRTEVTLWDGTLVPRGRVYGELMEFSATGPTIDGRIKPDIVAPGSTIIGAMSRNGNPDQGQVVVWPEPARPTGRYIAMTGTSMSSPIVAGVAALMLEADGSLTPEKVKQIIGETAIKDDKTGPLTIPQNRWGAGKINALEAVRSTLGISDVNSKPSPIKENRIAFSMHRNLLKIDSPLEISRIAIYDLRGRRCVLSGNFPDNTYVLPSLAHGAYTVLIYEKNGVISRGKIVISR